MHTLCVCVRPRGRGSINNFISYLFIHTHIFNVLSLEHTLFIIKFACCTHSLQSAHRHAVTRPHLSLSRLSTLTSYACNVSTQFTIHFVQRRESRRSMRRADRINFIFGTYENSIDTDTQMFACIFYFAIFSATRQQHVVCVCAARTADRALHSRDLAHVSFAPDGLSACVCAVRGAERRWNTVVSGRRVHNSEYTAARGYHIMHWAGIN